MAHGVWDVSQRRGCLGLRQYREPGDLPRLSVLLGQEVAALGRAKEPAVLGSAELLDVLADGAFRGLA
ncbi:hypothetical protein PYK79_49560 [Streptomyces sp. ID05-04B]|uniref:hypothetical protein n=1 Tax=unclassified Streptomyces TaxID=2593676 RepID=UPI00131F2B9A|nr:MULTISPECIES: hypothetical protein [unclassified Streptomyces]MDX5569738.1 hypothetical protein [Streptomyces sp. ID05-04B]